MNEPIDAGLAFAQYVFELPAEEQASLLPSMQAAPVLARVMQVGGAKVRGGDVQQALALLGLRLVSVDAPDAPDGQMIAAVAETRYDAAVESVACDCGREWARLRHSLGDVGWWHHGDNVDPDGFMRKCPEGKRPPRRD